MKIPLVLITVGAIGAVSVLIYFMRIDSFPFAWALNFLLMLFTFAFVEALKSQLSSPYFSEQGWEKRGKIYEILGINLFRKILVWVGWEKLNKRANPVDKSIAALLHLHQQTKKSELGHLIIFVIVVGFNIFVAFTHGAAASRWLFVLNILLNLYPVFLQRYNRPRLERAIHLSRRRAKIAA